MLKPVTWILRQKAAQDDSFGILFCRKQLRHSEERFARRRNQDKNVFNLAFFNCTTPFSARGRISPSAEKKGGIL
jgi:hypothetical protein